MSKKYMLILGLFSLLCGSGYSFEKVSTTRLFDACQQGNLLRVNRLIALGADVNAGKVETFKDQIVYTSPLYEAIKNAACFPNDEAKRNITGLLLINGRANPNLGKYNNIEGYFLTSSLSIPPICALFENREALINFNKDHFASLNGLVTGLVKNGVDINTPCVVSNDNYRDENSEIAFCYQESSCSYSFLNLCINHGYYHLVDQALKLGVDRSSGEMIRSEKGNFSTIPPIIGAYRQILDFQDESNDGGAWSSAHILWTEAMQLVADYQKQDYKNVSESVKEFSQPLMEWSIEDLEIYLEIYYKTYESHRTLGVLMNHGIDLKSVFQDYLVSDQLKKEAGSEDYRKITGRVNLFEKMHDIASFKKALRQSKINNVQILRNSQRRKTKLKRLQRK